MNFIVIFFSLCYVAISDSTIHMTLRAKQISGNNTYRLRIDMDHTLIPNKFREEIHYVFKDLFEFLEELVYW